MFRSIVTDLSPLELSLIAQEAIIDEVIFPGKEWWVKFEGSLWRARAKKQNIELDPGATVYVTARQNTMLFIQPMDTQ